MALTELPSTAPESLGPDKIDQRVYAGEPYRIQAFLVNKIRQYLIDIGSEVGLHDGSTVGSLVARVIALEAGGGGGGTDAQTIWTRPIYNGVAPTNGQVIAYDSANARWNYQTVASSAPHAVTIVVGNQAAGDTTLTCDYLDTGNGLGLQAAFNAANALPVKGKILQRRGNYVIDQTAVSLPLTAPAGWTWEGEGEYATVITTVPGGVGVNMTTFVLAAGTQNARTTMRKIGLRVPANGAGVAGAGPRGIVNFNAYTKIEDVDVVVAAGTATNTYSMFFQADYATAYPHGVEVRRLTHSAAAATNASLNAIYAINLRCSAVAPTAGAPTPLVEDVTYFGSTATSAPFGRAVYVQGPAVDVHRIRAFNAQAAVFAGGVLSYGGDVRGPCIEDVVNDIRGYVGSPTVQVWSTLIGHTSSSALTIRTPIIDKSLLLYDTSNIETSSLSVLGADTFVTYTDAMLRGVRADGTVNGGPNIGVESSSSTGSINGVSILDCGGHTTSLRIRGWAAGGGVTNARVVGGDFYNVVLDGAGNTTNTVISACTIRNNLTISTATVVNTIVTSNRIGGAYSDAGTGTALGTNSIG